MLLEVQCEKFAERIDGKLVPRKKIVFHEGLNTILGDKKAQNSIGKSTFLLVIDFCFGGDDYCDPNICNVTSFVEQHKIYFAFKFGDTIEYYCRDTVNKNVVLICNKDYSETGKEISISDFQAHLLAAYGIKTAENGFRSIVGRYARIYGRKNYDEQAPLKYAAENVAGAVKALEQLYGVYQLIKAYEELYENRKKRRSVRKLGIELGEITVIATSAKQVRKNEEEIERLQAELEEITAKQDQELSIQNTQNLDQAAKIKGQITSLKRRRTRLLSQLNAVKANLAGGMMPTSDDIAELQEYFPGVDLVRLETVESFHKKIQSILTAEMGNEIEKLELLIAAATDEMGVLEEEQRKLGVPAHVSKKFLERVVELENKIRGLRAQNQGYDNKKQLDEEYKNAQTQLNDARESQLSKVESIINQEMVRLNDFIYDGQRHAPEIHFSNKKSGNPSYDFGCKWNTGTGENYKNLIIFDLSILATTELPILIHDSLIFKNIADLPIDKIMRLYMQSKKQIFISFDKQEAFDSFTSKTVRDTSVIELHDDGGELFGWSWAKKEETETK